MSDPTPTREEVVEANIEAAEAKYGEDNFWKILMVIAKDIDISLAQLVDASPSS